MNDITKGFNTEITKGFSEKPIVTYSQNRDRYGNLIGVRILRPWELKALLKAIPKKYSKTQFEFLFYTGMRYVEAEAVKQRQDLFDGENIHLTPELIRKPKCTIKDRYVKLNPIGRRVAEEYFKLKKDLPHWNTWRENLTRWSNKAKIDNSYLSVKTTRKTWESYLIFTYPQYRDAIFISQGHTELTALKNYINLPFSQRNKDSMLTYVGGWD